jgi:hypothetical protein
VEPASGVREPVGVRLPADEPLLRERFEDATEEGDEAEGTARPFARPSLEAMTGCTAWEPERGLCRPLSFSLARCLRARRACSRDLVVASECVVSASWSGEGGLGGETRTSECGMVTR